MSRAVEVLAPTDLERAKKVIKGVERARVVRKPSSPVRNVLLVAWLSDLEVDTRRRELVVQVELLQKARDGVPFVLVTAKSTKARSYRTLEILTQWSRMVGFYLAPDMKAVRRMVRARAAGAKDKLMASALVEDGKLVVWSCEPRRYVVPVAQIPALADMRAEHLADLELNESGSRLRWEKADVDLDLHTVRYYTDPEAKKAQDRLRRQEANRYAKAIRSFRNERGLKQADIKGLTERQVRRVEQGESIPRSSSLEKLAVAHGLSMDQYLKELAKRSKG